MEHFACYAGNYEAGSHYLGHVSKEDAASKSCGFGTTVPL